MRIVGIRSCCPNSCYSFEMVKMMEVYEVWVYGCILINDSNFWPLVGMALKRENGSLELAKHLLLF